MLVLTAADVRKALPMRQTIEAMKRAFAALKDGRAQVPLRTRLPIFSHHALSLFMPAFSWSPEEEALAVKVVSLFPQNPSLGLAYIQAAVLVLEPGTGRALAILEGSSLTAIRTGAAGGAAIDLLARPGSHVVGIIGAGVQGRSQLEAACTIREIDQAWVYDVDPVRAQTFVAELSGRLPIPLDLQAAADPRQAVSGADVICTATTSPTPVFDDHDLKPGAHISAVGSYTPEMQGDPVRNGKACPRRCGFPFRGSG